MDNDFLICHVGLFSLESIIVFPDGKKQTVPTADLGKLLPVTCKMGGFNTVRFACQNKEYVNGIIDEAKIQECSQYGLTNINYEVLE